VFPWPFVWGFAQAARKLGVQVRTFTEVVGFKSHGARIDGVVVKSVAPGAADTTHVIETHKVVNACGAWSPEIAKMLGVDLPNTPHRHEICSTEPLKPWLKPLVADLSDGLYFSQSTRGEIVGGVGQERVPHGLNQDSSFAFLGIYARALARACPVLGDVKVLRQWAGCYDITPDSNPIVGEVDGVESFVQASGFMGHGFMMAPVMGKRIAEQIVHPSESELFTRWNLRRFKEGKLLSEAMIIG
jgi:sarcosine oxidase subunit beta